MAEYRKEESAHGGVPSYMSARSDQEVNVVLGADQFERVAKKLPIL